MDWHASDIDAFLELASVVEEPGFVCATWSPQGKTKDGAMILPYPEYNSVVYEMFGRVYSGTPIDPYKALPEDPPGTPNGMDTARLLRTVEAIEQASLDQVRRYLILTSRSERFVEGHIDDEFRSGRLLAAISRVRQLREQMD